MSAGGQLGLLADPPSVPDHRVRALAGVVAGMRWPGRGSFEALTKGQREVVLREARLMLERLALEDD